MSDMYTDGFLYGQEYPTQFDVIICGAVCPESVNDVAALIKWGLNVMAAEHMNINNNNEWFKFNCIIRNNCHNTR